MRRGGLLSREHVEEAVCGYGGEGKEERKEGRKEGRQKGRKKNLDEESKLLCIDQQNYHFLH